MGVAASTQAAPVAGSQRGARAARAGAYQRPAPSALMTQHMAAKAFLSYAWGGQVGGALPLQARAHSVAAELRRAFPTLPVCAYPQSTGPFQSCHLTPLLRTPAHSASSRGGHGKDGSSLLQLWHVTRHGGRD